MTSLLPEGWDLERLSKCINGKPEYGANSPGIKYSENLPRYLRITDIGDSGNLRINGKVSVQLEGNEKHFLEEGDFLFARSGATVGKTYLYRVSDGWLVFAGYLIRFKPNPGILLPEYLKNFTQTHRYLCWVKSTLRAGAQPNINAKEYSSLLIPLPPLAEQQKIAQILSTWDEAIAVTEKLITALEQRKKGLMQRLLSGQVRFPGFSVEWKKVKFSEVFNIQIGRTPSRSEPRYWDNNKDGDNVWVSISDLNSKFVNDSVEYISDLGVKESNITKVAKDSIIMSFKLTIGRVAITTKELYTNEAICALIPKDLKVINTQYIYHALSIVRFDKEIDQAVKGKTLNMKKINRLELLLPELNEQSKIANFFDEIDEEIFILKEYLAFLKQEKKGLMQRLLTGQVRVKVEE